MSTRAKVVMLSTGPLGAAIERALRALRENVDVEIVQVPDFKPHEPVEAVQHVDVSALLRAHGAGGNRAERRKAKSLARRRR